MSPEYAANLFKLQTQSRERLPKENTTITLYHYNEKDLIIRENFHLSEFHTFDKEGHVNWINITGPLNEQSIQSVANVFQMHPLMVEDILNKKQRAKVEDYGNQTYVVLRMFALAGNEILDQQVSFVLTNNIIVTFRDNDFGLFQTITEKLKNQNSIIRKRGEDFLLYMLLDTIIDSYYLVLNEINEQVENIDQIIISKPADHLGYSLQSMKRELLYIRKNILPVRDLINNLVRNDITYFDSENKYYLRDLQDHMVRNIEEAEFLREQLNSLTDLFYSLQTHKMNNVMKTLTGVSFVLLPLTFLASIYGMNFTHIPMAAHKYGFWEMIGLMSVIALVLTLFAFRRNWLNSKDFNNPDK